MACLWQIKLFNHIFLIGNICIWHHIFSKPTMERYPQTLWHIITYNGTLSINTMGHNPDFGFAKLSFKPGNVRVITFHRNMMASSNGNISRVTGHLCGEFTGHRWIPRTMASYAELWYSLWSGLNKRLSKQSWDWWFETLSRPLWRHRNDYDTYVCLNLK